MEWLWNSRTWVKILAPFILGELWGPLSASVISSITGTMQCSHVGAHGLIGKSNKQAVTIMCEMFQGDL